MTGKSFSHYKILEELGRGGMGIVYKAEDTKLDRTVAIKVLPSAAVASEDDRARFYREAKASAQLHHPHIASVFEIDEAVPSDAPYGTESSPFIAMEFIEGETLYERILKGPLKLEEVVRLASQIASGLEAAHEKDIVHRDVKSGNVMLTAKGDAKILDFGLAKTTHSTKLTRMGSTLGTVAYMSPEQARGEEVDQRTDIWSLGVVLYEMIAGRHPFPGDYEQAVVYEILNQNPEPLTAVRTGVPMALEWIVTKLFAKDPAERYQSCADLIVDLKTVDLKAPGMSRVSTSTGGSGVPAVEVGDRTASPRGSGKVWYKTPAALMIAIALAILAGFLVDRVVFDDSSSPVKTSGMRRDFIPLPQTSVTGDPIISPTGEHAAYTVLDSRWQFSIVVYEMATGEVHNIPTSWWPRTPRFSPDGMWIVYEGSRGLMKFSIPNGTPTPVVSSRGRLQGIWESNTSILLSSADGVIRRVSADGGDPVYVAAPDSTRNHTALIYPETFPSGQYFLATARTVDDSQDVVIVNARSGEYEILVSAAGYAQYSPTGHLIFTEGGQAEGQVIAQPFDLVRRRINGRRVSTPIGIRDRAHFSLGGEGTLVTIDRREDPKYKFSWIYVDNNTATDLPVESDMYWHPSISPDGEQIVVSSAAFLDNEGDVIVINVEDGTKQHLTFNSSRRYPTWSADGQYVYYEGGEYDSSRLYRRRADGGGREEEIEVDAFQAHEPTPSLDGNWIAYMATKSEGDVTDIMAYNLSDGSSVEVAAFDRNLIDPVFSPDARFVAFERNVENGQILVVKEFQGEGYWQVSDQEEFRAWDPKWSADGKYLYYRNPVTLFRVPVSFEPTFSVTGATEEVRSFFSDFNYDPHPDGNRILITSESAESSDQPEYFQMFENFYSWLLENVPADE